MAMSTEDRRRLAGQVGTSPFAINELLKEHPDREAWLTTAPRAEAVEWCRARLREKPDDLRTEGVKHHPSRCLHKGMFGTNCSNCDPNVSP